MATRLSAAAIPSAPVSRCQLSLQVRGELPMGEAPREDVGDGEALLIHTGGMLPAER